ncbi:MAG: lipoyl domain-containing protein, partial [Vicinamibacterales bacterium]
AGTGRLIALIESRDDFGLEWQEYVVENELDDFVEALKTFLFEVWKLATPDDADPLLARHFTGFVVGSRTIARAKSRIGRSTPDGRSLEVVLPALGGHSSDATIDRWFKRPGDLVQLDEPLLRLTAADDLAAWIPSPASGTLAEVRVQDGTTVSFNSVVAVITIA